MQAKLRELLCIAQPELAAAEIWHTQVEDYLTSAGDDLTAPNIIDLEPSQLVP